MTSDGKTCVCCTFLLEYPLVRAEGVIIVFLWDRMLLRHLGALHDMTTISFELLVSTVGHVNGGYMEFGGDMCH